MSIYAGSNQILPGYRIDCQFQVGCETTGDEPTEQSTRSAESEAAKTLGRISADVARAWEIYAGGPHPFTIVRKHLSPDGPSESEHIPWQSAEVYLRARADTAPIVQKKLMVDFLLSLTTDPDLRRRAPQLRSFGSEERLEYHLTAEHLLPALIAKAGRGDADLRAYAASPWPPDEPAAQRWLNANALLHAIDEKPYGALVEAARRLPGDRGGLPLLVFAGEAQAAELPAILDSFGPAGRAYAGPLLA